MRKFNRSFIMLKKMVTSFGYLFKAVLRFLKNERPVDQKEASIKKPWDAELRVNEVLAKRLIESQFIDLKPVTLEFLGEGWDNIVYRVNNDYVFRFPRRQVAVDFLETERNVLPHLSNRLPLQFPEPLFHGNPDSNYPWPFLGYHFLEGQTACSIGLSLQERSDLVAPLAAFLKSLHAISESEASTIGVEQDRIGKLDVKKCWPLVRQRLERIQELNLFDCNKLLTILDDLKHVQDTGTKSLAHGNICVRHLVLSEQKELMSIIDWGGVHVGNPAVDLAILFSFFPQSLHKLFFDVYGEIDEITQQLALFRAISYTSTIVLYSHDISDKDLLTEGLVGLRLISQQGLSA